MAGCRAATSTRAVTSAVALAFAAYFVVHTMRCADRWTAARLAVAGPGGAEVDVSAEPAGFGGLAGRGTALALRVPAALRCPSWIGALAHLLVTIAMAVMLVGMI